MEAAEAADGVLAEAEGVLEQPAGVVHRAGLQGVPLPGVEATEVAGVKGERNKFGEANREGGRTLERKGGGAGREPGESPWTMTDGTDDRESTEPRGNSDVLDTRRKKESKKERMKEKEITQGREEKEKQIRKCCHARARGRARPGESRQER